MNRNKLILLFILPLFTMSAAVLVSQEMITAADFFDNVSERYGDVFDYEAELTITQTVEEKDLVSTGTLFYKSPNLLRIDFVEPEDQIIVANGENLMIYLPKQVVVMTQKLKRHNDSTLASMASSQGLELLKKGYSIGYLEGPDRVPLDPDSEEMVIKLKLEWRTTDQGFRQIEMSVDENMLIRRMKALNAEMEEIQFDFIDLKINQNIPDARFDYEAPASAYEIKNFLFEPED